MARFGLRAAYCGWLLAVCAAGGALAADTDPQTADPLSEASRAALAKQQDEAIARSTEAIQKQPRNPDLYSRRGDALFFRGRFPEAVADYEKMVELDPDLETSHWRRGIAYFYAGKYREAAHQFEIYHSFDQVDRENGIWRFLSQARAYGIEKAREGLLKYKKDDREPFPAVYQLFAGKTTPDEILKQIADARLDPSEREKRLFYAELYIGLNYAVEDQPEQAAQHLRAAVRNTWGPKAGFGPNYMWHVGRLHYELLSQPKAK
jgi:lipoprotein NlpI